MILAVWLYYKCEHKWYLYIACAISVMLSFRLYQSYAGVGATLAICLAISGIVVHGEKGTDALRKMIGFAMNAIAGGIMYFLVLHVGLKVLHVTMADYKGANDISISKIISELDPNIVKAYTEFFSYHFSHEYIGNHFLNHVFCILLYLGILVVMAMTICKVKDVIDKLIVIALILAVPLGANIIDFIVTGSYLGIQATSGMTICMALAFLIAIQVLSQNSKEVCKRIAIVLAGGAVMYAWTNMIQIETDVLALEQSYSNGMYALEQINDTINRELDGQEDMHVAIIGNPEMGTYRLLDDIHELASAYAVEGNFWNVKENSWYGWTKLMKENYFAQYTFLSVEESIELAKQPEFIEMGNYPDADSVKVIEDVLVIKVSDLTGFRE